MAGEVIIDSDLILKGKAKVDTVPNSTGTVVTYNATSKIIGTRTNAEIIADIGLTPVVTNSHTHTNKTQLDTINQNMGTTHTPVFNGVTLGYTSSTFKGFSSATPFSFLNAGNAQIIYTKGVLTSDTYADATKIPTNGIYSKGIIESLGGFKKTSGTSSQFLKADGSSDSTVYLTSASLTGYATTSWVTTNFDKYTKWDLKTNGVQRIGVTSLSSVDFVNGTNISITYGAGGVVTINSPAFGTTAGTVAQGNHTHASYEYGSGTLANIESGETIAKLWTGGILKSAFVKSSQTDSVGLDPASAVIGYVYDVSLTDVYGNGDGALYAYAYADTYKHEIYGSCTTGQIATRGKNGATWGSWRKQLDHINFSTYYSNLAVIESLSGTSGFLKKTATNSWILDTKTYVDTTTSQNIAGEKSFTNNLSISPRLAMKDSVYGLEKFIINANVSRIVARKSGASTDEVTLFDWSGTDPRFQLPQNGSKMSIGHFHDHYNSEGEYNLIIGAGGIRATGSVKATGNFKSDAGSKNTLFIPDGTTSTIEHEILNEGLFNTSIRLRPLLLKPSNKEIIDDNHRLIRLYCSESGYIELVPYMYQNYRIYNISDDDVEIRKIVGGVYVSMITLAKGWCTEIDVDDTLTMHVEKEKEFTSY